MADADSYNSLIVSEWNTSKPADTDSIGDVGKAIRQIKETIVKVDETGVSGLTKYLEGTLKKFIVNTITDRFKHFYRVGDIICTRNPNNPSSIFGGTWALLENGAFLRASSLNPDEPLGTEESDLNVVNSPYDYVSVSGADKDGNEEASSVLCDFDYSNYEKYLVRSAGSGYWLYYKDSNWPDNQNDRVAVDYISTYMWMKISDEFDEYEETE